MAADDPLLDELYAVPRDEFATYRDRLVDALLAAGDPERARALAERRRPTRAADALNRLVRERPADVASYLATGDARQLDVLLARVDTHADLIARALLAARTDTDLAAVLVSGRLVWVPDPLDAPGRLARARAHERAARDEITRARAEVRRLQRALQLAHRRLHEAERDAERANAHRRQLER